MERESIARLLDDGLSLEQIGRRFGRHPSTVAYWVRKHGLRPANQGRHAARGPIDEAALAALVDAGSSIAQIAAQLGRGKSSVRHWLKRYGLATEDAQLRAANAPLRQGRPRLVEMRCRRHGMTAFALRGDGSGYRCLRCRALAVTVRRRRVKQALIDEAGGACVICGYDRCPGALHFHHLDPAAKSFSVSERGLARSLAEARTEARKCALLCSNCHAEVEAGLVAVPA